MKAFLASSLISLASAIPLRDGWTTVDSSRRSTDGSAPFEEDLAAEGLLGDHFGRPGLSAVFDYVIVGGGTAGLTMARRLAADTSSLVAVIEAGGFYELNNGNLSEIPADAFYYLGTAPSENDPLIDWQQNTTPQPGLGNRAVHFPQGRTFGGGSARNQMWYLRGPKGAYSRWAELVGDDSYEFDALLPYFEKSITFTPPATNLRAANATVQTGNLDGVRNGPLQVTYPNWANPVSSWVAIAFEELGMNQVHGFTDGVLNGGWSYTASTMKPGTQTRCSSEVAFLRESIMETTNLAIYEDTMARKILFNGTTATGVEVTSGTLTTSLTYNLTARKEVIVSAGVFHSPQLLMVSGVGPQAILEQQAIPVVAHLPGVGQNMWDHIFFGPDFQVDTVTHSNLADPSFSASATHDYNQYRTGILTNVGADMTAFEKLPGHLLDNATASALDSAFPPDWPHIQHILLDAYVGNAHDLLNGVPPAPGSYACPFTSLVAPFSRGNVSLASANTLDNPLVSPNWLTDPRDQTVAVAAFKRARELFNTSAMSSVVVGAEAYPGVDVQSDEEILQAVMAMASTVHHPVGTCRMGKADGSDEGAVVDTRGRVIGTEGLRLVDASVFPVLPPGMPQGTVYALAEKIADGILNGQ